MFPQYKNRRNPCIETYLNFIRTETLELIFVPPPPPRKWGWDISGCWRNIKILWFSWQLYNSRKTSGLKNPHESERLVSIRKPDKWNEYMAASLEINLPPLSPRSHLLLLSHHMKSNYRRTETSLSCFNRLSSRISVHTRWIICCGPFRFLLPTLKNYTRRQLWSRELFPTRTHDSEARDNLMWLLAYESSGLTRPTAMESPLTPRVAKRSLPMRGSHRNKSPFMITSHSFLFLAWLGLFNTEREREREREGGRGREREREREGRGRGRGREREREGEGERESWSESLSLLKVLCGDGWVSVHYRKGPDHHWMMTLLGATKPNWSRPPAANGPERNSPGWVMTVFSAFLCSPLWCPRTPPPPPLPQRPPAPCPPHTPEPGPVHPAARLSPLESLSLTHTSAQSCWSQCLCVLCTWQQMLQTDQGLKDHMSGWVMVLVSVPHSGAGRSFSVPLKLGRLSLGAKTGGIKCKENPRICRVH